MIHATPCMSINYLFFKIILTWKKYLFHYETDIQLVLFEILEIIEV